VFIKCYQCGGETLVPIVKHCVSDSIPRFLNNSKTIKAIDLKFLGHNVVYVVY